MKWGLTVLGVVGGAYVYACGPYLTKAVHFANDTPDFGRPAPSVFIEDSSSPNYHRPVPQLNPEFSYAEYPGGYDAIYQEQERLKALVVKAVKTEAAGDYAGAIAMWNDYVPRTKPRVMEYSELPPAEWARQRLEILQADIDPAARRELLTLTNQLRVKFDPKKIDALVAMAKAGGTAPIAGLAWYAAASALYDFGDETAALEPYTKAAEINGPRKEAAHVMVIRTLLAPKEPSLEHIERAKSALAAFRKEYPESRFRGNLAGWDLRLAFLQGNRVDALAGYLRQLSASKTVNDQAGNLVSVKRVLAALEPAEAKAFREKVMKEPDLLAPYLDYRLYHSEATSSDYAALARFVGEVRTANPTVELSGSILARLAEIEYLRGKYSDALAYAITSLDKADQSRADLATYVKAGVIARTGDSSGVNSTLEDYEKKFADSYLVKCALELRAIHREKLKQWAAAANDYRTLGYQLDLAYLLDVRMRPEEVVEYVSQAGEDRDRVTLAAGYRYLRIGDWAKASALFKSLPTEQRRKLAHVGSKDFGWYAEKAPAIADPLATTNALEKLSRDKSAKGMYALASYYYNRRNLLLYNADLWQGQRQWVGWAWNESLSTPADALALKQHHLTHECLNKAAEICRELAKKYPKSPYAAKALYRAATATRRLAAFNPYWRKMNRTSDRWAVSAALLRQVYVKYPNDPLAKNARKYEKVLLAEGKDARRWGDYE